jgi:hypothetical protein
MEEYENKAKWKKEWFDYIKSNKEHWREGWTLSALHKIEKTIYMDREITWDLLRHGADKFNPKGMIIHDKIAFDHCMCNFGSMIHQRIRTLILLKGKL